MREQPGSDAELAAERFATQAMAELGSPILILAAINCFSRNPGGAAGVPIAARVFPFFVAYRQKTAWPEKSRIHRRPNGFSNLCGVVAEIRSDVC